MLLQACCGPCACRQEAFADYDVTIFFCGNNFDSSQEYSRRLEALKIVNEKLYGGKKAIVIPYNPQIFDTCEDCIRERLQQCATAAKEHGFDCFSTTLTVSPHKNTALVNKIGSDVAKDVGVPFIEMNLKKSGGFYKTVEISKQLGLYRQNYCGCAKSVRN